MNTKKMTKTEMLQRLTEMGINVAEPEKVSKSQLAEMIVTAEKEEGTMTTTTETQKEEITETVTTEGIENPTEVVETTEKVNKKAERSSKKDEVGKEVDTWLAKFKEEAEGNGKTIVIKTWEKIPTCRSLKVDGVTYFEMYFSANGVRLNAKSELIPEEVRPEGSNIVKNGLDLCIPTFQNIAEGLTKYADVCRKSLAEKAEKKAAEKKAKEEEKKAAAEKAKAEKKAVKEAKKAVAEKAAE